LALAACATSDHARNTLRSRQTSGSTPSNRFAAQRSGGISHKFLHDAASESASDAVDHEAARWAPPPSPHGHDADESKSDHAARHRPTLPTSAPSIIAFDLLSNVTAFPEEGWPDTRRLRAHPDRGAAWNVGAWATANRHTVDIRPAAAAAAAWPCSH
jgi:hypothetical protein